MNGEAFSVALFPRARSYAIHVSEARSYLNFLGLVLNDGLLVLQRRFQLLVSLQQRLPEFSRELEICKRRKTGTCQINELCVNLNEAKIE